MPTHSDCADFAGANGDFYPVLLPVPPPEEAQIAALLAAPPLPTAEQQTAYQFALCLAESARNDKTDGLVGRLIAVYDLTSHEGRALMELAESLLRVPDAASQDALIADKLGGRGWQNTDATGFARAATLALSAVGLIAAAPDRQTLFAAAAKRLGMPAIRVCVAEAMKMMGGYFVFAETMEDAAANIDEQARYSFDMLGEAARCEEDAKRYYDSYLAAIRAVGNFSRRGDGVSIKLSALYSRYETRQYRAVGKVLLPRIVALVCEARRLEVPISLDAEESARLELSLAIIRQLAALPELADWDGLGVVVQAYNRRAAAVIDTIIAAARQNRRRMSVRLVKGAYWDAEIKIAQEKGLPDFPLYTRKAHTDVAFLHHAKTLLHSAHVYPQIATHNAASVAAVCHIAKLAGRDDFEFQRLHGMGAPLYRALAAETPHRLRIYAPVGGHDNLLAYLVRRLLENGANASFIHQLSDPSLAVEDIVANPADIARKSLEKDRDIRTGATLFLPRQNSRGWDLDDAATLAELQTVTKPFLSCPSPPPETAASDIANAWQILSASAGAWANRPPSARADVLEQFAALIEAEAPRFFGLLAVEGKKTIDDAVAELREAVDFCRFYAAEARQFNGTERPRGLVLAISPWNFPLAIFCGQVTAALATGNAVLAKPAEQTPRIAEAAAKLLRRAGLPQGALQMVYGRGETVGAQLAAAGMADMAVFTGSTETAKAIERGIAHSGKPHAPLLAETGGLNAMLVDSTALIERAVDDILRSAFQSAGQRCSALRMLYVQENIAEILLPMLCGAAGLLVVGAPQNFSADIGPMIDDAAKNSAQRYIDIAAREGRVLWRGQVPSGCYLPPTIIKTNGINDLSGEVFAPVLHVASYRAGDEEKIIDAINAVGYGLTFGTHGRIARKLDDMARRITAGNVYINRDQIGAIVGCQPFGGRGLSGTGPKAGGCLYLRAFTDNATPPQMAGERRLPSADGERNQYCIFGRGHVLCLSPDSNTAAQLAETAKRVGNRTTTAAALPADMQDIDAVMCESVTAAGKLRCALASASGRVIPIICRPADAVWLLGEKHICTDRTAFGGNIELLART